jgi:hypothetical protein
VIRFDKVDYSIGDRMILQNISFEVRRARRGSSSALRASGRAPRFGSSSAWSARIAATS